ncbi:MAG: hypothetical protein IT198_05620, partial [Acidimicrobiia bacterium]|nr:hypothetical protein [Acidimicrobiia bacterium]
QPPTPPAPPGPASPRPAEYGAPPPPLLPSEPVTIAQQGETATLTERWGSEQWTRPAWEVAAEPGVSHDLLGAGTATQDVHPPARNPHSRVDQDLLEAMHKSHESSKRPWLPPLLLFFFVLVGTGAWLWIGVLAPPDLEPGEAAFGHGAYAVQVEGMVTADAADMSHLAEVPDELGGGEAYRASASDVVLLLGMVPAKDSDTMREFQRASDAIQRDTGVVIEAKQVETPLGPGMQVAWADRDGIRHATILVVHEGRRIVLQTSSAASDPGALLQPVLLSLRATGRRPVSLPALGITFWLAVGLAVGGATLLGIVFAKRGRSVVGGIALGGVAGVVVGVVVGFVL